MEGQMYVEKLTPRHMKHKQPLVFIHGLAQTATVSRIRNLHHLRTSFNSRLRIGSTPQTTVKAGPLTSLSKATRSTFPTILNAVAQRGSPAQASWVRSRLLRYPHSSQRQRLSTHCRTHKRSSIHSGLVLAFPAILSSMPSMLAKCNPRMIP